MKAIAEGMLVVAAMLAGVAGMMVMLVAACATTPPPAPHVWTFSDCAANGPVRSPSYSDTEKALMASSCHLVPDVYGNSVCICAKDGTVWPWQE